MPDTMLLGLFHEATPTADTIEQLGRLGAAEGDITVMSGIPYQPEMLGRRPQYEFLVQIALLGAFTGLVAGLFLTVGTPLLYSLYVGGQPLVPGPPTLIILFEFTMLGAMVATFGGLLARSWFPGWGHEVYDPRVTEGHIGVLVRVPVQLADQAEQILKDNGAHHLRRIEGTLFERQRERRFPTWERLMANRAVFERLIVILVILAIPTLIGMAMAYSFFYLPIPNQMVEQLSIDYEEGPRLAAPAVAVPVQGPVLIGDQPATEPLPSTPASVQRGSVFYGYTCLACHGPRGQGNGPLASYFSPKPANLTDVVKQQTAQDIFLVVTHGKGFMPSLRENLTVSDRWDVINYVRTLTP